MNDRATIQELASTEPTSEACLEQLLAGPVTRAEPPPTHARIEGVLVGTLVGFVDGCTPLVVYPGQPGTAALSARLAIDLMPDHIGDEIVLMFESGDPVRPIVTGRLRKPTSWPPQGRPTQIEADVDGQRLCVTAKDQIVLTCGKASITLTAAGKVLISGTYVLHRSAGVMRIKGGSIQLN